MHATRPQARLGHHETVALATQQIGRGHPHITEHQLAVPFRRHVMHDRNIAHQLHTGCVERHNDHALLTARLTIRIGLAHDDEKRTIGMRGVGDEPLAAVDHVLIALTADQRLDITRIGRGHIRFGHGEGRADFAVEQGLQPAFVLLRRGEHMQQLHVAGVRGVAVEYLRRPTDAAHDLCQRRVLEIAQAAARLVSVQRREKQVPQPLFLRQRFQVTHEGHRKLTGSNFPVPLRKTRYNVLVQKTANLLAECFGVGAVGKIHSLPPLEVNPAVIEPTCRGVTLKARSWREFWLSCIRG